MGVYLKKNFLKIFYFSGNNFTLISIKPNKKQ